MTRRPRRPKPRPTQHDAALKFVVTLLTVSLLALAAAGAMVHRGANERRQLEAQLAEAEQRWAYDRARLEQSHLADQRRATRLWAMFDLSEAIVEVENRNFGQARARLASAARNLRHVNGDADRSLADRIESIEIDPESDLAMTAHLLTTIRDSVESHLPEAPPDFEPATDSIAGR